MDKINHGSSLLTFGAVATIFNTLSKKGYTLCQGVNPLSSGQAFLLGAGIYVISHLFQRALFQPETGISLRQPAPIIPSWKDIKVTVITGVVSNLVFIGITTSSAVTGGAIAIVAIIAAIIVKIIIRVVTQLFTSKTQTKVSPDKNKTEETKEIKTEETKEKDPIPKKELIVSEEEKKLLESIIQNPQCPDFKSLKNQDINKTLINKFSDHVLNGKMDALKRRYFLASLLERMVASALYGNGEFPEFGCKEYLPKDLKAQLELLENIYKNNPIPTTSNSKIPDLALTPFVIEETTVNALYNSNQKYFQNIGPLVNAKEHVQLDLENLDLFCTKILTENKCKKKAGFYIDVEGKPKMIWSTLLEFASREDVDHFYLMGPASLPPIPTDIKNKKDFSNLIQKLHFDPQGQYHFDLSKEYILIDEEASESLRALCPTISGPFVEGTKIHDYTLCPLVSLAIWKSLFKSTHIKLPYIEDSDFNNLFEEQFFDGVTYFDLSQGIHLTTEIFPQLRKLTKGKEVSFVLSTTLKIKKDNLQDLKIDNPIDLRRELFSTKIPLFSDEEEITERSFTTQEGNGWTPFCPRLYNGLWDYASVFIIPAALTGTLRAQSFSGKWMRMDPCSVALWLYQESYKKMPKSESKFDITIFDINAYQNQGLNDDNIDSFIETFPHLKRICLTATNVSQKKVNDLIKKHENKIDVYFDEEDKSKNNILSTLKIKNAQRIKQQLEKEYTDLIHTYLKKMEIKFETNLSINELRLKFKETAECNLNDEEEAKKIFNKQLQLQYCYLFMETFCPENIEMSQSQDVFKWDNFAFFIDGKMLQVNKFLMIQKCPEFAILPKDGSWRAEMAVSGTTSLENYYGFEGVGVTFERVKFILECALEDNDLLIEQKANDFLMFDFNQASEQNCAEYLDQIRLLLNFSNQWKAKKLFQHLLSTLVERLDKLIPDKIDNKNKVKNTINKIQEIMELAAIQKFTIGPTEILEPLWELLKTKFPEEKKILQKIYANFNLQKIILTPFGPSGTGTMGYY